ncbi:MULTISPECIES: GNAT family N-acetyltransferase [Pseudonocardia]|uniref:Mycothiol acetyltransferase n=2 Tax=Pseudonocardia TaxID=1847 RepID=A0A1Y2MZE6_PSEAH|nr:MULTISPECIES: GNAT family N-acetyltransferase [Pseudonocardia]OSY40563.1 Mycothiol acetyltransferase [Pseudonocardia autotrophica]TDN73641.1 L-amino acid N-acyltransferase YncA [Pseudonocardia autotrophica]BBG04385.1 putative acetyltransferase [Pseudonocardia autotrophica]GEC27132.1 putative acetyltransferase [Pseudonocardia saturnea]
MSGVRPAGPGDVPAVVRLVHELAEYEKAADECLLTGDQLHTALFGRDPSATALVATTGDGTVVGTAIWFRTFSTWEGVAGMHLEDLYVSPAHRGDGHGLRLLAALAAECTRRGWARLEWNVLDWNAPAIGFYRSIGAGPNEGWTTYRLTDGPLAALAQRSG